MVHGRAWSVIGAHNTSSQQKTRSDDLVAETFLGTVATPGSLPTDSAAAELGIVSLASRESVVVACVIWVHLLTDSFKFRKRLIERWQLRKRTHPWMPGAIESFKRVTCMLSDATKQHLGFSERLQQNHRSNSTLPLRFNINCQDQLCIHHSHRFFNHLGRLWSSSLSQGVAACRRRSWTRPSAMSKTSIPLASLCGSRHNSDEMDLGVLALCRLTKLPKLVVVNQQFKILHTSYTSYRIVEPDLSSNDL